MVVNLPLSDGRGPLRLPRGDTTRMQQGVSEPVERAENIRTGVGGAKEKLSALKFDCFERTERVCTLVDKLFYCTPGNKIRERRGDNLTSEKASAERAGCGTRTPPATSSSTPAIRGKQYATRKYEGKQTVFIPAENSHACSCSRRRKKRSQPPVRDTWVGQETVACCVEGRALNFRHRYNQILPPN